MKVRQAKKIYKIYLRNTMVYNDNQMLKAMKIIYRHDLHGMKMETYESWLQDIKWPNSIEEY